MKVMIVTYAFPPTNVIGAIRVGKLARYLHRAGHDLRVLTAEIGEDQSLPLEIPSECVIRTKYRGRRGSLDPLIRWLRRSATQVSGPGEISTTQQRELRKSRWEILRRQYHGLMNIPDSWIDWVKTAVPAGRRLIEEWKPDLIFASAPPFTCLVVASRLARTFDIPWIADFRDLWVDNPYYSEPAWRKPIDAAIESLTLRNATVLVTVSPIWAEQLRRRHGKATEIVYNGYAAEDFPEATLRPGGGSLLTIRYTGSIYRGFRDPSALFSAIALLPETLRDRVKVEFYGDSSDEILALAKQYRIRDRVAASPPVPYRRALELQMSADILLLLQWSDVRDEGNLPGKTFEYLYARRPILLIGYEQGAAARLIRERGAGLVSNAPERICDQLHTWIDDKQTRRLTRLDASVSRGLSRDEQFCKLDAIFAEVINSHRNGKRAA
jgi:glycosyltransferase involved in cell wall biosynthesis